MLLERTCPGCGAMGASPCAACVAALRPAPSLPPPPGVDGCRALFSYDGPAREVVARLKFRNHRDALGSLAAAVSSLVVAGEVDVVTWAPTSPARRRARGFDQAELLARAVARRHGLPCRRLLVRRRGPPQTGRSAADRWASSPSFSRSWRRPAARVLLVDDVVTTGATVSAAARCLRDAGADHVLVLALARTPAPRSRRGAGDDHPPDGRSGARADGSQ